MFTDKEIKKRRYLERVMNKKWKWIMSIILLSLFVSVALELLYIIIRVKTISFDIELLFSSLGALLMGVVIAFMMFKDNKIRYNELWQKEEHNSNEQP